MIGDTVKGQAQVIQIPVRKRCFDAIRYQAQKLAPPFPKSFETPRSPKGAKRREVLCPLCWVHQTKEKKVTQYRDKQGGRIEEYKR